VPVEFRQIIFSLEKALRHTAKAADGAVLKASFAHAVEAPNNVGRLDIDTIAQQLRSAGERDSAHLIASWCDELAFRSDQYVQRAALAATRAEAEAMRLRNREIFREADYRR
jgi:hypothetical protein